MKEDQAKATIESAKTQLEETRVYLLRIQVPVRYAPG